MSQRPKPSSSATAPLPKKRLTAPTASLTTQQSLSAGPRGIPTRDGSSSEPEIVEDQAEIEELTQKANKRKREIAKQKRKGKQKDIGPADYVEITDSEGDKPPPKRPRNSIKPLPEEIIELSDSDDNAPPASTLTSASRPRESLVTQKSASPLQSKVSGTPSSQGGVSSPVLPERPSNPLSNAGPSKSSSRPWISKAIFRARPRTPPSQDGPSTPASSSRVISPAQAVVDTSGANHNTVRDSDPPRSQGGFSLTNAVKTWDMHIDGSVAGSPPHDDAHIPSDPPASSEAPAEASRTLLDETVRLGNDPRKLEEILHELFLATQGELTDVAKEVISSLRGTGANVDDALVQAAQTEALRSLTNDAAPSEGRPHPTESVAETNHRPEPQVEQPASDTEKVEQQPQEGHNQAPSVTVPELNSDDEDALLRQALELSKTEHDAVETEEMTLMRVLEESMRVDDENGGDENDVDLQLAISQSISMASAAGGTQIRPPSPGNPPGPRGSEPLFYSDPEETSEPEDEQEDEEDEPEMPDDEDGIDSSAGSSPTDESQFSGFQDLDPGSPSDTTEDEAFRTVGEVEAAQAEPVPPMFGRPILLTNRARTASPPFPGQEISHSSSHSSPVASPEPSQPSGGIKPTNSSPTMINEKPQLSVQTSLLSNIPPLPRRKKVPLRDDLAESSSVSVAPVAVSGLTQTSITAPTTQRPPLPSKRRRQAEIFASQATTQRNTTVPRFEGDVGGLQTMDVGSITADLPPKRGRKKEATSSRPLNRTGLSDLTKAMSLGQDRPGNVVSPSRRTSTPVSDGLAGLVEDQLHVASPKTTHPAELFVDDMRISPARVEMDLNYDFEYEEDEPVAEKRPTSVEGYTGDVSSEDALDLLPSMGSQPMFSQPSVQESIGMLDLFSDSVLVDTYVTHDSSAVKDGEISSEPETPILDDDTPHRYGRLSSRHSSSSTSSSSFGPRTPGQFSPSHEGEVALLSSDFRKIVLSQPVEYKKAKDIPTAIEDTFNARSDSAKKDAGNRLMFESWIQYNTMDDEPQAPVIRLENLIDTEPCPKMEFHYSNSMWLSNSVPPPTMKGLKHCDCVGSCSSPRNKDRCSCLTRQKKMLKPYRDFTSLYDENKRLISPNDQFIINECNDLCGCDESCTNRVVQQGRKVKVKIAKTDGKGWGIFSDEPKTIPKGTFLGIYAGELMHVSEEYDRAVYYDDIIGRTYIFGLDFHWLKEAPNKYFTDAFHVGNFTRYVNHSCSPNITVQGVYINEANIEKPLMCMFTHEDVKPGQELCFSYVGTDSDDEQKQAEAHGKGTRKKKGKKNLKNKKGQMKRVTRKGKHGKCMCGALRCKGGYIF